MNTENKKEIYELLCKLKETSKIFNMMNGPLYSSIYADKLDDIYNTLKYTYSIDIQFYQPCDGRVTFYNLDELINEYKCD